MATKWDKGTISTWEKKGRSVCGSLVGADDVTLRRAKDKEAAETRLWIMEARRDKLTDLAETVQDEAEERS
jgi:hypothetical protein